MESMTVAEALTAAARRNSDLASAYRLVSRRSLSRSLQGLATSAAEQRRKLGEDLGAIAQGLGNPDRRISLPPPPAFALPDQPSCEGEARALLEVFLAAENQDQAFYEALAAALANEGDSAALLHAVADQARKRAAVARDHLDLLAL